MSSFPYVPPASIFNTLDYSTIEDSGISLSEADARYFRLTGGYVPYINSASYLLDGAPLDINLISGVTAGISANGKALSLNSSGVLDKLTLDMAGTGLNIPSLKFNGTTFNQSYYIGITEGGASSSKAVILNSTLDYSGIRNLSITGDFVASTSITSPSISSQTNTLSLSSGGDMLRLVTTNSGARNTIKFTNDIQVWEIGTRGSTASNANTFYIYNADYKLLMQPNGDTKILSSTNSTSQTTGCLVLQGGLGISGTTWMSQLKLNSSGSHLSFNNSNSGGTALIELAAAPSILRFVRGYAINIGSSGVRIGSGTTADPTRPLDFGSTAADCIISLFNDGQYGFGAADQAIKYSAQSHHYFYTGGLANTLIAKMESSGNFSAVAGLHCTGFANPNNSGAHMHFGGGTASFFGYDYPNSKWLPTQIGSCVYIMPSSTSNGNSSSGGMNVNSSSSSYLCPLAVYGSSNFTRVIGGFGFLNSGGAGNASSFSNRPFGIYSEKGILVDSGEIDCFSDVRLKKNIQPLDDTKIMKLLNIPPIKFQYIHQSDDDPKYHLSFRAQDLVKAGFNEIIGYTDLLDDIELEEEDIICDDGSTVHLGKNQKLVLSMQEMIPILTRLIQIQQKQINEHQQQIDELFALLNNVILVMQEY